MPLFSFPWNVKKPKKDASSADPYQATSPSERRRAVRIETPDIVASLEYDSGKTVVPTIVDMSTLGVGIVLDQAPESSEATFTFNGPDILKGLHLRAIKRHFQELPVQEGRNQCQIGYEFVFSSAEEQNRLLRWLALHLASEIDVHAPEKPRSTPFSATYYSDLPHNLEIRFPNTQNEFEQSLDLIPRLSVHHALIQTKFFLVLQKESVIACLPLYADTLPFKLLADHVFPEHLKSLRSMGRNLGEISSPYFKEDVPFLKNPSSSQLLKLRILFSLFPHVLTYAKNFAHLTDLVVLSPPHLEEFFHMWLFKEIGQEAKVIERKSGQLRNGYRLMCLNLKSFGKTVAGDRPELSSLLEPFEQSPALVAKFQNSYFPDGAVLRKWFREKNNIIAGLTPDQTSYFHSLCPDLLK